jgi:tRNA pseudouridine38-40 synthase
VLPPLENNRAWHVRDPIDYHLLAATVKLFVGRHDFASFAANRGDPVADTVRTLRSVRVRKSGPLLTFHFEGDGFLYKMVRLMVGALVGIGLGKAAPNEIRSRLAHPAKSITPARNVAPATGLFLFRVRY